MKLMKTAQMKAILTLAVAMFCGVVFADGTNNVAPRGQPPAPPALFTRAIRLDGKLFMANLRKQMLLTDGESDLQLMRRFFFENDIEMTRPRSVFLSDRHGFVVYNTREEIDK